MSIKPFKIEVPQRTLDDLRRRLENTRWPDEVAGAGWDYGMNLTYLKELAEYWRRDFDWRKQEEALNRFSHFRAKIDGVGIHFIHERGKGKNPLPIILTHGFPDSFLRFLKVIPLLTDPAAHGGDAADSFDVVVPSLPGYGFSDKLKEPGMIFRAAELWKKLMAEELGYARFAAHGGDWGATLTELLAQKFPAALIGIHLTDVPFWHLFQKPADPSEAEKEYFAKIEKWRQKEGAYAMIQGTKPQTLAYGLNDSPVGLAAWLVEKFREWSDCGGDVETRFTKDELLTNVMIYWATETINSAFLPYYDFTNGKPPADATKRVDVPTAFAIFPNDLVTPPRDWGERFYNVKRWTPMFRGRHFAAMEEPELLVEDIRAFFRAVREPTGWAGGMKAVY